MSFYPKTKQSHLFDDAANNFSRVQAILANLSIIRQQSLAVVVSPMEEHDEFLVKIYEEGIYSDPVQAVIEQTAEAYRSAEKLANGDLVWVTHRRGKLDVYITGKANTQEYSPKSIAVKMVKLAKGMVG